MMDDENNLLAVMAVCSGIFRCVYVACVTYAVVMFDNPKILAWWILAVLMGLSYSTKGKEHTNGMDFLRK